MRVPVAPIVWSSLWLIAAIQARIIKFRGGSFDPAKEKDAYGNEVMLRKYHSPQGRYMYVDTSVPLPYGNLEEYLLYTHNINTGNVLGLRLQIWRPTDSDRNYLLVWERRIAVQLDSPDGYFYQIQLDKSEQFITQSGDVIGWTPESSSCPISFDYQDHPTVRGNFENGALPTVGQNYTFSSQPFSAVFSVAVIVRPIPETTVMNIESTDMASGEATTAASDGTSTGSPTTRREDELRQKSTTSSYTGTGNSIRYQGLHALTATSLVLIYTMKES